jgi:predicted Na+-dependent transporter
MRGQEYFFADTFPWLQILIVSLVSTLFFLTGLALFNKKEFKEE